MTAGRPAAKRTTVLLRELDLVRIAELSAHHGGLDTTETLRLALSVAHQVIINQAEGGVVVVRRADGTETKAVFL